MGPRPPSSIALLLLAAMASSAYAAAAPAAQSRYTRIDNCRVTRLYTKDVGFRETRCAGVGGYALQPSESDGRAELAVLAPGGRRQALNLTGVVGSGFGSLGRTAEWRVRRSRSGAVPRAVIVRFDVAEDADQPTRQTSFLVVVSLSAARSCVIGWIAPGRDQNGSARRRADAGGPCLRPR